MIRDLIDREKLRRAALYLVYILAAVFLQDTFFGSLRLFGMNMMFLPAAAVAIGTFAGGVWGAAFGVVLGFLADISYGYTALFIALFPVMGFFAGVLTRWYVNASLFAYLVMCFAAFAVTALFQMARPAYESGEIIVLVRDGLIQCVWSLPMAAALYFPCRGIAKPKI